MNLLILASASPRRHALLKRLGLPFQVRPSAIDEEPGNEGPEKMVVRLALDKARSVSSPGVPALIIGADTTIDLDGIVFGKPSDDAGAIEMLERLRGREHNVLTGLALLHTQSQTQRSAVVRTRVKMKACSKQQIEAYVQSGEPLDKAGAYAIQGKGAALVGSIHGCYLNVVGMPLCELAKMLGSFGAVPASAGPVCTLPDGRPCPRLSADRASRRDLE